MATCPRCGRPVGALHPMPAEVITKRLVATIGEDEGLADLHVCPSCIDELMRTG